METRVGSYLSTLCVVCGVSEKPGFLEALEARDEAFGDLIAETRARSRADGALSAKTKALMAMAIDAASNHPDGVASLAAAARAEGASETEITETIAVVTSMCGLQGLSAGSRAFSAEPDGAGDDGTTAPADESS